MAEVADLRSEEEGVEDGRSFLICVACYGHGYLLRPLLNWVFVLATDNPLNWHSLNRGDLAHLRASPRK